MKKRLRIFTTPPPVEAPTGPLDGEGREGGVVEVVGGGEGGGRLVVRGVDVITGVDVTVFVFGFGTVLVLVLPGRVQVLPFAQHPDTPSTMSQ